MNENTLLKRFFEDGIEFDPDKQFGLSHKVRIRRIREIVLLMRKHHVMDGLSVQRSSLTLPLQRSA